MALGPKGMRRFLNWYPPYLFTRTKVKSIAPDWKEVVVELPKSLLTKNYVNTTFGGSMLAAADPIYMIMLIGIFGLKDYVIWDKAVSAEFIKPARSKLTYRFSLTDAQIEKMRQDLEGAGKILPEFTVDGVDEEGDACIRIKRTVYVRKKGFKSTPIDGSKKGD